MSKTKTLHKFLLPALTLLLTLILMSALQRSAQAATTHTITAWTAINVTNGDTVTSYGAPINSTVNGAPIVVDTSGGDVAFTLKNINLTAKDGKHVIYITGSGNCTITLEGTVKLKATGDLTVSIWHNGTGDIIIKGTAAAGSAFIGGSYGIVANKNVTIASDAVINGKIEGASGIHSSTGNVAINGTTGAITGTSGSGIHASAGDVTINGSTGAITGGTNGVGIQAFDGSVTIGATAKITGEIMGGIHGIFANGDVTINGSTAAITGGTTGDGIRAGGTNGSVTIGATARITGEIKGGQHGIFSDKGDVTISGTTGAITGTSHYGILADDLTISGPVASISGSANVVYARSGYAILDYSGSLLDTAKLYPTSFFTVDFDYGTTDFRGPVRGYFTSGRQIPTFTAAKAGILLEGWYKDSGLATPWNFSSDTVTDSITLYAKWEGPASTDASLDTLTVSAGTLDPDFATDNYDYTVSVENSVMSIEITAEIPSDQGMTLSGDVGTRPLSVGQNVFKVTVYAEDLYTHEVYTITVTRAAPPVPPAPPPGGGSTTPETIPAVDGEVAVDYTQSGETVTLDLPASKVEEIIEAADGGTASFDISGVEEASEAVIPASALKTLAEAGLDVEIKLPQGTVTLDGGALATAVASGGNVTVSLTEVKPETLTAAQKEQIKPGDVVFEISLMAGTKVIHELNGTVTVTVPYDGELPAAVWYLNDAGELEKLACSYRNGFVTFTTGHLSLYVLGKDTAWQNPFTDVKESDWFYGDVEYVYTRGLMNGTGAATFGPNAFLSRGMFATILWRLEDSPDVSALANPFSDVVADMYYYDAVKWAAEKGIVKGYDDGRFGPDAPVTREELVTMLYRYIQMNGGGFEGPWMFLVDFADRDDIAEWAYEAVCYCTVSEIVNGKPGRLFDPQGTATRAEVATMLYNFLEAMK